MRDKVKLFMVFDILGDIVRTGPQLWYIDRDRLEDVKNHVLDLLLICRILKDELPSFLDFDKIYDYIIFHDLPEAITGDITAFEGVTKEEREEVTKLAIQYLSYRFGNVIDLSSIINGFENKVDIEAKVAYMIDKLHSASTFIKYQAEKNIDMDDSRIISTLKEHPFVVEKKKEGKDLADIFYEFHLNAINISEDECKKYMISREDALKIVNAIKGFLDEMYKEKQEFNLLDVKNDFPVLAMKFKRNKI